MPTFGLRLYHRGRARRNPEVLNPTLTSPSSPCATSQAGERDEGDNVTSFLRQGNEVPSPTPHLPEASLQFQPCVPAAESPPTLRLDKKKKKKKDIAAKAGNETLLRGLPGLCEILPGLLKTASCRESNSPVPPHTAPFGGRRLIRELPQLHYSPPRPKLRLAVVLVKNSAQRKVENFNNSSLMAKKAKAADKEHRCSQHHPCCSHV